MTGIQIKSVYEPAAKEDGARSLWNACDRAGLKRKEALHMDAWCKNLASSGDLRRWFNHDLTKWKEFQQRYQVELAAISSSESSIRTLISTAVS